MKIKVLIIDDSAIIRGIIKEIINEQPDMVVVGEAPDPLVARELIRSLNPDVLTLDVEMPNMNGLSFLKRLMRLRPMPVVMLSSHTQEGTDVAFRALAMGAVDFIGKPMAGEVASGGYARLIGEKIRAAYAARDKIEPLDLARAVDAEEVLPMLGNTRTAAQKLIVMAASTGGTEALRHILAVLPKDSPGIVIALDIPANFSKHFVKKLAETCQVGVKEAVDAEPVLPGQVYFAPGDHHVTVEKHGTRGFGVKVTHGDPVNERRPSADVLFQSAAAACGADGTGVILTGMGNDGAAGLLAMRQSGAHTIAQDEATSVVFGMPKAAIEAQAVAEIVALPDIARQVIQSLTRKS